MKKYLNLKVLITSAILILCAMCMAVSSGKSTKSGRGVYAGVDHSGFDQVIYLRDDGTYTEELGKADWKTRVDGTYTISGNKLITTDKKGIKDEYEYTTADKNAMLAPGSFYMFKAQIPKNKIPDGVYSFYVGTVSGSAGIGVSGAGGNGYIKFEGNRFIEYSGSFSSMSTSSAEGGSSSSNKASGTYTINNGDLTLKYNNGTVKRHSFFYVPPTSSGKGAMVVLDGSIYYTD